MNKTKISWVSKGKMQGYTWNPVTGCTPIGKGCRNCYAKKLAETRLRGTFGYPVSGPFSIVLHCDRLEEPLKIKKPSRIFVCSMGDLFHEDVPDSYIEDVIDIVGKCPQHQFLFLSKRYGRAIRSKHANKNVKIGVSISNEEDWERYNSEARYHAHFISFEPLLEQTYNINFSFNGHISFCDWIIVGGESGANARPFDPDWARAIRDICKKVRTPFFMKQMSGTGKALHAIPEDLQIREYPDW